MVATEQDRRPALAAASTLVVLAAAALMAAPAQAEDKLRYQTFRYVEAGDRIRVTAADLSIEKDFGTDHALSLDIGHDAISGASPCWKLKTGYTNEYTSALCKLADEVRNSISAGWTLRDTARNEYTFGAAWSKEPDFDSRELSANALLWADESHNRSFAIGGAWQHNTSVATPYTNNAQDRSADTLSVQLGVTQVLDRSSTAELNVFAARDDGYLSNHYLKIVRNSAAGLRYLSDDSRPEQRSGGGVAARWIKAWRADVKTNLWLRGYSDDWGVKGATVEAKAYWDVTSTWRINPVLRLNKQGAADFYRGYDATVNTFAVTGYGSNDARLGAFRATTVQLNAEYHASPVWTFNGGVQHYRQSTGLKASTVTVGLALGF